MKIILIGNRATKDDPEQYYQQYADFFNQAGTLSNIKPSIDYTFFDDLIIGVGDDDFTIFDTRHNLDIKEYDMILIRGEGFRQMFDVLKSISCYARHNAITLINDYSAFRDSSKLTQAVQFFECGIAVARSVYVNEAVLKENAPIGIDFPCIMKATFGAHGNDNYKVNSMDEVREISGKSSDIKFVLQRFVPNNKDYRILVIGDEVLVIGREAAEGSHLNNTSQGGSANLAGEEVPKSVIADAIRITKHLDMTFSGVDVLADNSTGEYYFLEVNSQPQLMSGAFVNKKAEIIGRFFDKKA